LNSCSKPSPKYLNQLEISPIINLQSTDSNLHRSEISNINSNDTHQTKPARAIYSTDFAKTSLFETEDGSLKSTINFKIPSDQLQNKEKSYSDSSSSESIDKFLENSAKVIYEKHKVKGKNMSNGKKEQGLKMKVEESESSNFEIILTEQEYITQNLKKCKMMDRLMRSRLGPRV
jgi:hypothetical protein